MESAKSEGVKPADALANFHWQGRPVHRVRILKRESDEGLAWIRDRDGKPYKAYAKGEILFTDIFELPDGSWAGQSLSRFDAARGKEPIAPEGARHLMRLYKNDVVSVEIDGQRQAMRVYALEPSAKRVRLAPHHIAGNPDQRHADPEDPFIRILASYGKLREWQAMPLHVDCLGRVFRRKV